ncbi:DUF2188 domain-containing protein [Sediminibacterium sp. TEGAF015]|jgi:uncharacterized protein YdaT|uniref:DUF2188 domain-containing protein n=1 Tax=Sediminibacterium sp. TEGAF015 TaxID=575378 RepID=UPI0021FB7813|nr:DUF2188 domain-containing protein [Sediminibacterium sp. TEGAF015]BDQ12738.1 hypothetical protein TEGAF0_19550 [Sediminibacterium sp. TEGAF015]
MRKNQHVVPHGNNWAVKGAGNEKNTKIMPTQKQAIEKARAIARNQQSELVIHNRDGKIRDKDSFGNDPRKSKG